MEKSHLFTVLSKQASRCIRKRQAWFLNLAETTRKGFYQVNVMIMNPKGRTWRSWRRHTKFPIPPPQPPCSRAASSFPSGKAQKLKREETKINNQCLSTEDTNFCSDSTREDGDQGKNAPINTPHIIPAAHYELLGCFWQAQQ